MSGNGTISPRQAVSCPSPPGWGDPWSAPDARILAFFEGLLSALAESTEEEIDSGRWEKKVKAAHGPLRFRLALPDLLEGGEPLSTSGKDPEDLAVDLLLEAEEARGRRRILLARRALEICPEFAEAYEFLGDLAPDAESALDLYTRGAWLLPSGSSGRRSSKSRSALSGIS